MGFDKRNVVLALLVAVSVVSLTGMGATAVAASDADCGFPVTKTDATGTDVTVEEEPSRVVTLSPSAAQTMWEIGAKDKVVGVTKYADYLDGADAKTNVSGGGYTTVVVEKVLALEPDLVLVPNATYNLLAGKVGQLRDAGLNVYVFGAADSLADISEKTKLAGRLVGECAGAEETVSTMEAELSTVREAVEGEDRPDVLFVLGPGGYTAGEGTFIDTAIETAGGNNIAVEENITGYRQISAEVVADRDPDWIVKPSGVSLPDSPAYENTTAVQEGNVLTVNQDFISQPAPQIVQPIRKMAKTFHPSAYEEAAATPTATPSPSPTATELPTATATETTPGFGIAVALVALAGLVVLAGRH